MVGGVVVVVGWEGAKVEAVAAATAVRLNGGSGRPEQQQTWGWWLTKLSGPASIG